jgi:two-component system, OmpR family, KDP operon response regulator KdpE
LLARVRALLRRTAGQSAPPPLLSFGELEVDLAQRRVRCAGVEIELTRTEFDILACLAQHAERVVTSKMLLESVWGPEYGEDTQTLRVHISHLRKKIEPHPSVPRYIITEPGVGFSLKA